MKNKRNLVLLKASFYSLLLTMICVSLLVILIENSGGIKGQIIPLLLFSSGIFCIFYLIAFWITMVLDLSRRQVDDFRLDYSLKRRWTIAMWCFGLPSMFIYYWKYYKRF